jgi:hypothetical protein
MKKKVGIFRAFKGKDILPKINFQGIFHFIAQEIE